MRRDHQGTEKNHSKRKSMQNISARTLWAPKIYEHFPTECLFHIKGAFPIDTEIPGDTWEASPGEHWFGGYMCPNPLVVLGICVQTGNQCSFTGQ